MKIAPPNRDWTQSFANFALAENRPSLDFEFASAHRLHDPSEIALQFTFYDSTSSGSSTLDAGAGSLCMSMLPVR